MIPLCCSYACFWLGTKILLHLGFNVLSLFQVWMRGTVLLADALVLVPAVLAFARTTGAAPKRSLALVLILLYPGLIIIDNLSSGRRTTNLNHQHPFFRMSCLFINNILHLSGLRILIINTLSFGKVPPNTISPS